MSAAYSLPETAQTNTSVMASVTNDLPIMSLTS